MFCDLANLGLVALWTLWWTCYIVYLCSLWSTYHIVNLWSMWSICNIVNLWSLWSTCYIVNLWSLWSTCYIVNCELVVFVIFVNFVYCELVLLTFLYWYGYRLYLRFRPIPMYFLYRTFDFDVSEISISFPFPKLPFPISFAIKKYENGNGFSVFRSFPTVFTPRTGTWVCCPVRRHVTQPLGFRAQATVEAFSSLKGKCALGPFLSILVIECQLKCLNVNLCNGWTKFKSRAKVRF
jgi:hypothetical protein